MDVEATQVFFPSRERCFEHPHFARFGETVTCIHCGSEEVVKRGTTAKDAQQCCCKDCETYFNDLSDSIFGQYHFELEDLFYMVKEMRSDPRTQITRNLGRDYEAALDFVHEVQETSVSIGEFDLSEMCEADEVYVITGEKGRVRKRIRVRASGGSKKVCGDFEKINQHS